YLEPVSTALAGFIPALFAIQHLDHQTLARCLDRFVEECLDLVQLLPIHVCGKGKFALNGLERLVKQRTTLPEWLFHHRLAVEIEEVESEHAHLSLDVFCFDVLLLTRHELLEGEDLLLLDIPCYGLAV